MTATTTMRRYRTMQHCIVRMQPSDFAHELRRLGPGHVFVGWPCKWDATWVVRMLGGFVRARRLVAVEA